MLALKPAVRKPPVGPFELATGASDVVAEDACDAVSDVDGDAAVNVDA